MIPSLQSSKNQNQVIQTTANPTAANAGEHQSTSMLQETPMESEDGAQAVLVSSGMNGTSGRLMLQTSKNNDKSVKVSQFTD